MPNRPSFLAYPRFDKDAHPGLDAAMVTDLASRRAVWTDYSEQAPGCTRKEELVGPSTPGRSCGGA